ncbi:DUF2339 domain-containing protein [Hoeflea alexandrii]|nr:DUF2339 domain-containing protein [Hoeflea alexandrii]MCY0154049.1 DUF2339 domain-containing protein [Hoeflea alexandrii]
MFSLLGFMLLIALALWVRSVSLEQRRMAEQLALLRRELDRLPVGVAAESGAGTGDEPAEPRRDAPESTGAGPEPEGSEPKAAEAADAARLSADAAAGRAETGGAGPERRDEDDTGLPEAAVLAASSPGKGMDLESLIGGRWSALLGGLAVALGVLFLARYSIEAGLLGPRARMTMGTLLSLALFGAGEFMRRRDRQEAMPTLMSADIPGILTGAGAIGAFGTIYAAYVLYGFVGPAVAFVGLTVLGIASLLLSAVHGPKLAALGLVGAYVSPLLVSSQDPNPVAFGAHILVVTAAVMGVARIRGWRWLAIGGIAGSTGLALLLLTISTLTAWFTLGLLLVALFAVHVTSLVAGIEDRPDPLADRAAARLAVGALLCIVMVAAFAVLAWDTQVPLLLLVSGLAAVMVGAGGIWPSLSLIAPLSAVLAVVAMLSLRIDFPVIPGITSGLDVRDGLMAPDLGGFVRNSLLLSVPSFLLAVFFGLRAAATAPVAAGRLAIAVSAIAALTMAAIYLSVAPFETHVPTGLAALALSAMMVGLTEKFGRARPDDWSAAAPAWLAVGAVALAGLAVAILLTRQWMPLGFAVTAACACLIHGRRPVPALGWLAVVLSLLASSGLHFNAPFSADVIGSTPFVNWLVVIIALLSRAPDLGRSGVARIGRAPARRTGDCLRPCSCRAVRGAGAAPLHRRRRYHRCAVRPDRHGDPVYCGALLFRRAAMGCPAQRRERLSAGLACRRSARHRGDGDRADRGVQSVPEPGSCGRRAGVQPAASRLPDPWPACRPDRLSCLGSTAQMVPDRLWRNRRHIAVHLRIADGPARISGREGRLSAQYIGCGDLGLLGGVADHGGLHAGARTGLAVIASAGGVGGGHLADGREGVSHRHVGAHRRLAGVLVHRPRRVVDGHRPVLSAGVAAHRQPVRGQGLNRAFVDSGRC